MPWGGETGQDSPQDVMAFRTVVTAATAREASTRGHQGSTVDAMRQHCWEEGSSSAGQDRGQEAGSGVSKIRGWY